jgi:hypothetical protein
MMLEGWTREKSAASFDPVSYPIGKRKKRFNGNTEIYFGIIPVGERDLASRNREIRE